MEEQSKFVTFTYIGGTFGTMITYPISGFILEGLGWEVYDSRISCVYHIYHQSMFIINSILSFVPHFFPDYP